MAEWLNLTNAEYHARPEISNSMLSTLVNDGPRVYRDRYVTRTHKKEPTDAMVIGTMVHTLFETGELAGIAVEQSGLKSRNSKAWDSFAAASEAAGLIPVTAAMAETAELAWSELANNPKFIEITDGLKRESSLIWRGECGLDLRCRFDAHEEGRVVDIKTTSGGIDVGSIVATIQEWGYYRQAGFYALGHFAAYGSFPTFVFAFVQKNYPYESTLFQMPETWLVTGVNEVRERLADLVTRYALNDWERSTYGKIVTGDEPRWAKYQNEYAL